MADAKKRVKELHEMGKREEEIAQALHDEGFTIEETRDAMNECNFLAYIPTYQPGWPVRELFVGQYAKYGYGDVLIPQSELLKLPHVDWRVEPT